MTVLGFNYTKINAERKKSVNGKVSISNNVSITDVESTDIKLEESKNALRISFKYSSNYKPEVASMTIEGNMLYMDKEKDSEDLIEEWKENKKLPKEVMRNVINYVLGKCNVQAIIMSRDLNIPSPIPLPKIGEDKEGKKD